MSNSEVSIVETKVKHFQLEVFDQEGRRFLHLVFKTEEAANRVNDQLWRLVKSEICFLLDFNSEELVNNQNTLQFGLQSVMVGYSRLSWYLVAKTTEEKK